ncbi:MAG: LysR family transcriptional regulator [Anaerolineae bacterium]|nr:LysR family transcriptional regulator [Anaerolineae bacterium]
MLSLYKLEIFAAVVLEGSFSAAAERLLMTQSAVSQHINDLENALGTRLFKRGRRGVTLTAPGETLYAYTQRLLNLVAEAEAAVTDVANLPSGQLTLGATPVIAVYLLPDWIGSFREVYPRLTIALQTDITAQIAANVMHHKLELGFVEGELAGIHYAGLGSLDLQPIRLFVVVGEGHPWWGRPAVAVADLHDQPFITRQPGSQTRQWTDAQLEAHGIRRQVVAEFDNPESIKRAVASGMGIAILPECAMQHELLRGTLHALPIEGVPLQRMLKLLWAQQTPLSPITRTFLASLLPLFPQLGALLAPEEAGLGR